MRLLVDIYDAAGERLGDGPITTAISASVTRALDGAGSISIQFPEADARVHDLIAPKRRAHLLVDHEDGTPIREVGRLIIEKSKLKQGKSGFTRSIDGPDNLGELKFTNVRRGRVFNGATVQAVVDALLGLTSGWSRGGAAANLVSARFDGASILKALVALVEQQGIHFRQNPLYSVEIGSFGQSNGLTVVNRETAPPELYHNDAILLIDSLTLDEDSEDIVNWLEPIGAGEGDAAITLEKAMATRTTALGYPYAIQTETGPDGRTLYFLKDQASINSYGQVELVGDFNQIVPVGTAEADQVAIAEALYDAAAAHLARYKDPYVSYGLTVRKTRENLLPGDKIRLQDKFRVVDDNGNIVDIIDVNADFWILEVMENFGVSGNPVQLKIASVDRVARGEADIVVGAIESINIANLSVRGYFSHNSWVDAFDIDPTHGVRFELNITERTQSIVLCTVRLVTMPFRANAVGAKAGGSSVETSDATAHKHTFASPDATYGGGFTTRQFRCWDPIANDYTYFQLPVSGGATVIHQTLNESPDHTHDVTIPAHTHPQDYGIFDDTDYPDHIGLIVNGTAHTTGLDASGAGLDQTFDVTALIVAETPLQQVHTIDIQCTGGQGRAKVFVEVWEIIQSVSVFA